MKISINLIEKALREHVVAKNIREDADMTLDIYEVYDPHQADFKANCLYLLRPQELQAALGFPEGLNVVCSGQPDGLDIRNYQHLNLLVIAGMTPEKNMNNIIRIFHRYQAFDEQLNALILANAPLQEIIDLGTEIIAMPINILDLKHKVLAISSALDASDDPIWRSLKQGFMSEHYENILNNSPTMSEIIRAKGQAIEITSSISGHHVRVSLLRCGGRPVAYFGMHKVIETGKPFEKSALQLYVYLCQKINRHASQYFEVKADRGLVYEEFLHNLFEQKFNDDHEVEALLHKLGFAPEATYQLGLISFRDPDIRADLYFTLMDYLEKLVPEAKCIAMDLFIYIIIPLEQDDYLAARVQENIASFLGRHRCLCLLSPPFCAFSKLHQFKPMFEAMLVFINKQGRADRLYHFYEFAPLYGIKLLTEALPGKPLVHPLIQKLSAHDREHQSDYLKTLTVYLRNQSSISLTASELHMHRNSLQYRVNRIEALLGQSFDDWKLREQLLFQLLYLEYQELFSQK